MLVAPGSIDFEFLQGGPERTLVLLGELTISNRIPVEEFRPGYTMTDDQSTLEERIERLEATIDNQQETIESLKSKVESSTGSLPRPTRRQTIQGLGLAGLVGLGATSASADVTPQGRVGTEDRPLDALNTTTINGPPVNEGNLDINVGIDEDGDFSNDAQLDFNVGVYGGDPVKVMDLSRLEVNLGPEEHAGNASITMREEVNFDGPLRVNENSISSVDNINFANGTNQLTAGPIAAGIILKDDDTNEWERENDVNLEGVSDLIDGDVEIITIELDISPFYDSDEIVGAVTQFTDSNYPDDGGIWINIVEGEPPEVEVRVWSESVTGFHFALFPLPEQE